MRLNRFLFDSIRRFARGERGSAMAAVLGLLGVTTVVGLTITAVTVNAIGYTSSTRADIQSRAAAEAGIDVTEAGLRTAGDCATHNGVYTSATAPVYATQVSYKTVGNWITGCPVPTSTSVRVVSVGTAAASGVNGASAGNTTSLEAIYAFIPATGSITATGGAITTPTGYLTNSSKVTQNGSSTTPGSADVHITTSGVYKCDSGTIITGNLFVENGSAQLDACIVLGNVRVAGFVSLNNKTSVGGNVIAAGLNGAIGPYANATGYVYDSTIGGSLTVGGKISLQAAKITGNVVGATVSTVVNAIAPDVRIAGNLSLSGTFTTWGEPALCNLLGGVTKLLCALTNGIVGGAAAILAPGLTAPSAPASTPWAAYTYRASDWTSVGFTEVLWTGSCTVDNTPVNQAALNAILAYTTPVVVNALNCSKLLFSSSSTLQLKLKSDLAFVSNNFGLEAMNIDSNVAAGVRLWFVVPGTAPLGVSLCLNLKLDINSTVTVTAKVAALVYTPGCVKNSTTSWHGQFYAGGVEFNSNSSLDYVAVGLPGVNLDGGTTTTTTTGGVMGSRTSLRDLAG